MMEKVCLIIDDTDQEKNFETNITNVLKKEAINASLKYINPRRPEYNSDGKMDLSKIKDRILEILGSSHVSVFASDYNLASKEFNGIDMIFFFQQQKPKTPMIIYSGTLEEVIADIINFGNVTAEEKAKKIKKLKLVEFSGKDYYQSMLGILRNPELSLNDMFLSKLKEHSDLEFKSCYPKFKGKQLGQIAHDIETKGYHGKNFQEELIDQAIDYLININ